MKIEVVSGNVKWTVESTGHIKQEDFIAVITNSSISSVKFIELYYDYYTETKSARLAYEKVEKLHNDLFNRNKYGDYESFRAVKSKLMKK